MPNIEIWVTKLEIVGSAFVVVLDKKILDSIVGEYYTKLVDIGEYLVATPYGTNSAFYLNKNTLEIEYVYPHIGGGGVNALHMTCHCEPYVIGPLTGSYDTFRAIKLDLVAGFTASATSGNAPLTVNFTAV